MSEIYFDNAATTRVDDIVISQMADVMKNEYGNPSSLHSRGVAAEQRLEKARQQILQALGAKGGRLLFTSGATESSNLALFGAARALSRRGDHIVTTALEHASVLSCCEELKRQGFSLTVVPAEANGRIDAERFLAACGEKTILASAMLVNNEIGTVQPVADIARGLRQKSPVALMHCDAVQAFGKIPFSVSKLGVDMLSISGHKLHAPKGSGALWLRDGVRILPLVFGGGQQHGLRPGTESVPMAAALGAAAHESVSEMTANSERILALRARLISQLSKLDGIVLHTPAAADGDVSPYILNFSVMGYRSETLLHFLAARNIYVSSASACSKGAQSHVLAAMGCSAREIDSTIRVSFSKYNTPDQTDAFIEALSVAMREIKRT